jgi:hypothetical protein
MAAGAVRQCPEQFRSKSAVRGRRCRRILPRRSILPFPRIRQFRSTRRLARAALITKPKANEIEQRTSYLSLHAADRGCEADHQRQRPRLLSHAGDSGRRAGNGRWRFVRKRLVLSRRQRHDRAAPPNPFFSQLYHDNTLGYVVIWEGVAWRQPSTGCAV